MSSDGNKKFDKMQTDNSVDACVQDKPSTSVDVNEVDALVKIESVQIKTVRNVLTQHGDHRSVDEENIVVLRNCVSPDPHAMDTDTETIEDDVKALEVVWIEPFAIELDEQVC